MEPIEFLKTIYLGDRYCKNFIINSDKKQVELYVNCISRIRDKSGEWNYYTDEDIDDGILVITGVEKVILDKSGILPNDQLYDVYAEKTNNNYKFIIETSNVDDKNNTIDLIIEIIGTGVHLLDPNKPFDLITK